MNPAYVGLVIGQTGHCHIRMDVQLCPSKAKNYYYYEGLKRIQKITFQTRFKRTIRDIRYPNCQECTSRATICFCYH